MNDSDNKQICSYKDIDRFGFTCDVCGRKINGCHYINGMSFCEKCYQETFGKDNQQNEIQQLKQQLAEKDKEIEHLKDGLNMCQSIKRYDVGEMLIENTKLKLHQTQLAIQELEKLKEKINCEMSIREYDISEQTADVCVSIAEQIDQQIKLLKGEKDGR